MKYYVLFLCSLAFVCCHGEEQDTKPNLAKPMAKITYTVWTGDEVEKQRRIKLNVKVNSTFYDVMVKAARRDPKDFSFEATLHPKYGHYITAIGGESENRSNNLYWMVYVLNSKPTLNEKPGRDKLSDFGVDSLLVQKNKHYLFWLKTLELDPTTTTAASIE